MHATHASEILVIAGYSAPTGRAGQYWYRVRDSSTRFVQNGRDTVQGEACPTLAAVAW